MWYQPLNSVPLLSIWIHPRQTVRERLAVGPTRYVLLWAVLAGIEESLQRTVTRHDQASSPTMAITGVIVGGVLSGLITLWIGALLLKWTGQGMNGTASTQQLRAALGWAAVPTAAALLLWIPFLAVSGPNLLLGEHGETSGHAALLDFLSSADFVLAIWSIVLQCNTVAEVQGFRSAWMGLANLILVGLLVALLGALLIVAVMGIAALWHPH